MFYSCTSVSSKSSSASGRCAVISLRRAVYSDASVLRYYCIYATASSTLRIAGCQMVAKLPRLHSPSAKPHHVILAPLFVRLSCVQCMYMCSSNTHTLRRSCGFVLRFSFTAVSGDYQTITALCDEAGTNRRLSSLSALESRATLVPSCVCCAPYRFVFAPYLSGQSGIHDDAGSGAEASFAVSTPAAAASMYNMHCQWASSAARLLCSA